MTRNELLQQIKDPKQIWDIIVIGGGATGLGCAVEAASRGYRTLLIEQSDFAKATSSRSTKLIHGGVRYLKQGNLSLVLEALHKRGYLLKNAPHLVRNLSFVVPLYDWWEGPFYGIGLKFYDMMAGRLGLGPSRHLAGRRPWSGSRQWNRKACAAALSIMTASLTMPGWRSPSPIP